MEILYERCCGLDVHERSVVACLIAPGEGREPRREIRTFGTMTEDIPAPSDRLAESGCTHAAMESTGVYWKPIRNLLEGSFALPLVNAQHVKAVPGRKTDARDCEWIADLLRHGPLRPSFVPERSRRELREPTRYRRTLVRERSAEVNRLQKTLEGANHEWIELLGDPVATDVTGKSARRMLRALIAGSTDAATMARMAERKLRAKIPELERALSGRFAPHQRFMLAEQLAHIDYLGESIERVSGEIEERVRPFEAENERLDSIPGGGQAHRRGAGIGDRGRRRPLPHRGAPGEPGRDVSGR
jgi:transposase